MESFDICVRGLTSATQLLVHPSVINPAELMDLFHKLAEFYELFDCRISIATLVDVYKDHLTAHFTRLRTYALKNGTEILPHVDFTRSELRLAVGTSSRVTSAAELVPYM